MTEQELRNLQIYIGKRNQGQTDVQVIEHINKINNKTPLTQEEWNKLIIPCCNNGYVEILKFVLAHIHTLSDIKFYINHTVYLRNISRSADRIEVLKILIPYLKSEKEECLSDTMITAAWFGQTEIVKFLIENGANRNHKDHDLGLEECAERAEKIFNDSSLKEYLAQI